MKDGPISTSALSAAREKGRRGIKKQSFTCTFCITALNSTAKRRQDCTKWCKCLGKDLKLARENCLDSQATTTGRHATTQLKVRRFSRTSCLRNTIRHWVCKIVLSNLTCYGTKKGRPTRRVAQLETRRELTILSLSSTFCENFSNEAGGGIKLWGREGAFAIPKTPRPHQIHLRRQRIVRLAEWGSERGQSRDAQR